jgi:predicted  nucleic acid-binding Zn-ribbon protein
MAGQPGSETVSLAEHQTKIAEFSQKIATLEASLGETKTKAAAAEKAKADGEAALSQAKGRVDVLEKETVSLNAKIKSLSDEVAAKAAEIKKLSDDAAAGEAEKKVDGLIAEGKIVPAERDAMLELCKKDPELFGKLTANRATMPALRQPQGSDGGGKNVSAADRLEATVKEKAAALRKERPSLSDTEARVIALRDPDVAKLYGQAEGEKKNR